VIDCQVLLDIIASDKVYSQGPYLGRKRKGWWVWGNPDL